jgi:hypothetical protein
MPAPSVRNTQRCVFSHHPWVVSVTWFKVDDKLHSHSKTRKVLAEAPAALALWVVAGSWSSDNLTDGLIPDHQLPWLIPVGAEDMARQLVAARLWKRVKGGYQFHQWAADGDGTKRNPLRAEVEAERLKKAEAGRKGGLASGKVRSKSEAPASAPASRFVQPPTRPDPTLMGGALSDPLTPRAEPPSPRCPEHLNHPDPPYCGRCADARKARAAWEVADANRRRNAPKCRRHRGQPASNCALCRSEELAEAED